MISQGNVLQSTTQKYLEIFDITNDVLLLQDGSVSMVLSSTAINFDLYSEEEQDAAIYAYAALLNSLSFPIEIVMRSQKKDVSTYLDLLRDQEAKAFSPVNKKNIKEYRDFVEELVQERNVLEKKFYIIITYSALEAGIISGSTFIPGMQKKKTTALDKTATLDKAITNLQPRRDHLAHQFARIGLSVHQLSTQDLIQLFYTIYNPESAKGVRLGDSQEYSTPLIQADVRPVELVQAPPSLPAINELLPTPEKPATPQPIAQPPAPPISATPVPPLATSPQPQIQLEQTKPVEMTPPPPPVTPATPVVPVPVSPMPELVMEQPTPSAPIMPVSPAPSEQMGGNPMSSSVKEESFTITSDLKPPTPPVTPNNATVPPVQTTPGAVPQT